jgi:hypothetical protein
MTPAKSATPSTEHICKEPDCHANAIALGLCMKHYQRERRGSEVTRERAPVGEGKQITLRCTLDELGAWEKAAKKTKKAFRDWIRDTLNGAVGGKP